MTNINAFGSEIKVIDRYMALHMLKQIIQGVGRVEITEYVLVCLGDVNRSNAKCTQQNKKSKQNDNRNELTRTTFANTSRASSSGG